MDDPRQLLKQTFLDHLASEGTPRAHLSTYAEYLDLLFRQLGESDLIELSPENLYQQALTAVELLDGDEVIETYLFLVEQFLEFWTDRWEKMHPE